MIGLGMIHSHFVASVGASSADKGFFTTTTEDEVISFPQQLNCIEIFSSDTELEIYINNDPNPLFLSVNDSQGITGLPINRIIVKGAAGKKVKWIGLTSENNT